MPRWMKTIYRCALIWNGDLKHLRITGDGSGACLQFVERSNYPTVQEYIDQRTKECTQQ